MNRVRSRPHHVGAAGGRTSGMSTPSRARKRARSMRPNASQPTSVSQARAMAGTTVMASPSDTDRPVMTRVKAIVPRIRSNTMWMAPNQVRGATTAPTTCLTPGPVLRPPWEMTAGLPGSASAGPTAAEARAGRDMVATVENPRSGTIRAAPADAGVVPTLDSGGACMVAAARFPDRGPHARTPCLLVLPPPLRRHRRLARARRRADGRIGGSRLPVHRERSAHRHRFGQSLPAAGPGVPGRQPRIGSGRVRRRRRIRLARRPSRRHELPRRGGHHASRGWGDLTAGRTGTGVGRRSRRLRLGGLRRRRHLRRGDGHRGPDGTGHHRARTGPGCGRRSPVDCSPRARCRRPRSSGCWPPA